MADGHKYVPSVIRSTRDYNRVPVSPVPGSPESSDVTRPSSSISTLSGDDESPTTSTLSDNPREIRNKAEKQRRDKLNHSISELAAMVPPVVAANRKIDKTGVLRLTAHYLRAHQYVFGDSISQSTQEFKATSTQAILGLLKGFLLTTTYKGIIVVVSQNVQQYLGYSELDLLGQNILNITHQDDHQSLKDHLKPESHLLGPNGELLIPDEPDGKQRITDALASKKKRFIVRFKKLNQRSEPTQYVTCYVEGSLRKSDRACRGYNRCCQMVRRARARGDNPCSSGNDVVFIGMVRPMAETFISETALESFKMEYRTRHSVDGEIIQCEQRIALVTGYMTHEVNGVNAMNFMHRDDVRWVIIALREMYDQHRMVGESCYRLMTKNGQFIYMRTRGCLDVEGDSRAVRSFVCTNTVVEEQEGKHLIKLMKKKFMLMVNNNEELPEEDKEVTDNQIVTVEDPRQLEKVILHLVTNLPSPLKEDCQESPDVASPLSIIPPKKERIVSAIEKIYSVIKTIQREPYQGRSMEQLKNTDKGDTSPAPQQNEAVDVPKPETISNQLLIRQLEKMNSVTQFHQPFRSFATPRNEPITESEENIQPRPEQSLTSGMKRQMFDAANTENISRKKKIIETTLPQDDSVPVTLPGSGESGSDGNDPGLSIPSDNIDIETLFEDGASLFNMEQTIDPHFLGSMMVQQYLEREDDDSD